MEDPFVWAMIKWGLIMAPVLVLVAILEHKARLWDLKRAMKELERLEHLEAERNKSNL